jgi:hypothetical protein
MDVQEDLNSLSLRLDSTAEGLTHAIGRIASIEHSVVGPETIRTLNDRLIEVNTRIDVAFESNSHAAVRIAVTETKLASLEDRITAGQADAKRFWKKPEFWIALAAAVVSVISGIGTIRDQFFSQPSTTLRPANAPPLSIRRGKRNVEFVMSIALLNLGKVQDLVEPYDALIESVGTSSASKIAFDPDDIRLRDSSGREARDAIIDKEKAWDGECILSVPKGSTPYQKLQARAVQNQAATYHLTVTFSTQNGEISKDFYFQADKGDLVGAEPPGLDVVTTATPP